MACSVPRRQGAESVPTGSGEAPIEQPWAWDDFPLGMNENGKPITGVVKHRTTEEYYAGQGEWTADQAAAMQFGSLSQLAEEADRYQIKDCCEFIVQFGGSDVAIYLPI